MRIFLAHAAATRVAGSRLRNAATGGAVALTLVSAWVLYTESTATRRLESQVLSADRQRERLEDEIAVLKAERAYLARPSRIEQAARALGMRPALERQYVRIDEIAADVDASGR